MSDDRDRKLSIILPAKNEAESLKVLLPQIREQFEDAEIIVVNDGSTDGTSQICSQLNVIEVLHAASRGNGAAVKAGVRKATGDVVVMMDADGQHLPSEIPKLLTKLGVGVDMVVGMRDQQAHASTGRRLANNFYNWFASFVTQRKIGDLTSGFRAAKREVFMEYLYLLPNGFSYPTTSTMALLREGYGVEFCPVTVEQRQDKKSHIKPLRDGFRFFLIIVKVTSLYSPLVVFLPLALIFGALGFGYSVFTLLEAGRFTNMGALMLSFSILVFLVGLVSEQITTLIYKR